MDREAGTVGGSMMPTDDLEITSRQRVEAAEITFGQIGRNAHECIALLGSQQAGCLGYHAACLGKPAAGRMAGSGMGLANLSQ